MDVALIPWYIRHRAHPRKYASTGLAQAVGVSKRLVFFWIHEQRNPNKEQADRIREYTNKLKSEG